MNKQISFISIVCAAMLAACSDHEGGGSGAVTYSDVAVSFATEVENGGSRAAATGLINDLKGLQNASFGVFAYFTDRDPWEDLTTKDDGEGGKTPYVPGDALPSEYPLPDFMYNQSVTWRTQWVEKDNDGNPVVDGDGNPIEHEDWMYSPLKYWPNSTENAIPRYISFFAYAPYESAPEANATGIVGIPDGTDRSPHVQYLLGSGGNQVDLLYAHKTDATRNGEGLIYFKDGTETWEKVPLTFHHALACVEFYVQRIYDETDFTGKKPDSETHTKLFVSKLELAADPGFMTGGNLSLETGEWTPFDSPSTSSTLTYTETMFQTAISGTAETGADYIRGRELDKWSVEDNGVDATERLLFPEAYAPLFLPQATELTLTPTLTYSMVAQDNELALSDLTDSKGNKYVRMVNTVTGNKVKFRFEAGKKYKVVIHIGVEHVAVDVASVEDWDLPLRFTPDVEPYSEETRPHTLDEN